MGSIIHKISNIINRPTWSYYTLVKMIARRHPLWVSDKLYEKAQIYLSVGRKLNLNNPHTFNEKLQWLKLYYRRPEYSIMVDKYAVKKYVADIVGEEYIIPTFGVWNRTEDVDWNSLPEKFVLKCTHDSGGLIICHDKEKLDKNAALARLNECLKRDFYILEREWPYKNVPRRIIAEKLLEDETRSNDDLTDYKFYCFNGKPTYCQVINDRSSHETIDFFDMEWQHQEFVGLNPNARNAEVSPPKPKQFEEMKKIAQLLAGNIPFSRIDLYNVSNLVYFGEITLYPASGQGRFDPEEYNSILGNLIQLPQPYKK